MEQAGHRTFRSHALDIKLWWDSAEWRSRDTHEIVTNSATIGYMTGNCLTHLASFLSPILLPVAPLLFVPFCMVDFGQRADIV